MDPKIYTENQVNIPGMIIKVFRKCEEEMLNNKLNNALMNPIERVSDYLGVSRATVHAAIVPLNETIEFEFTISNRLLVYKLLAEMYTAKSKKTEDNVFKPENIYQSLLKVKQSGRKPSISCDNFNITFEGLGKLIHQMKLEYRNLPNSEYILMSNPDDAYERYFYLDNINKARKANKHIYYVDERLLQATRNIIRPWTVQSLTKDTEEIKGGFVFYHAVSQSGYMNGLFCNHFSKENFEKWLTEVVIPLLEPSSVLVIAKTANDRIITTEPISKYDSKATMMQWLRENNIPHGPKMHKAELYKLTQRFFRRTTYHSLEKLLKPYGHQILLLPHTLYDLSVPELAWEAIQVNSRQFRLNPEVGLNEFKRMMAHLFSSITEETWTRYKTKVEFIEKQLLDIELKTDVSLEHYHVIDIKDST